MKRLCAIAVLGLSAADLSAAADWPQYRGPGGLGVSAEKDWRAVEPKRLWDACIGAGFGAASVAGDRVYVVGASAVSNNAETVFCFEAATGREVWRHSYGQALGRSRSPACCTPTVVDGRVYTFGSGAMLTCLDALTGKVIWSEEIKASPTPYGYCASPLVVNGVVVVPVLTGPGRPPAAGGAYPYDGGALVGFDTKTGKELWRATDGCSPWSTPVAGMFAGRMTVVHLTGSAVIGVDPLTGQRLWLYDHKVPVRDQRCYSIAASPLIVGDIVVAPSHIREQGVIGLRVREDKVELVWNAPEQTWYQTGTVWGDLLFLPQGGSSLVCCDVKTGTQLWATGDLSRASGTTTPSEIVETEGMAAVRRPLRQLRPGEARHHGPGGMSGGAFIVADGKVLLVNARGELLVAQATGKGYEPLLRTKVSDAAAPGHWGYQTYPVLSGGRLFCRNGSELVCFDVRVRM
jgi:outer membrane protein assembly factor BamB